jgi:hypothetical protein
MPRPARTALLAWLMAMAVASTAIGAGGSGAGSAGVIGCSTVTAGGRNLSSAQPTSTNVGAAPFGVAVVPGFAFVANGSGTLKVLADRDNAPHVIHSINLPGEDGLGATVTTDRRYLLIASGAGAIVVDVARAEAGEHDSVLGMLDAHQGYGGAIEVPTSRDGRYAFVSLEGAGQIAVYRLAAAISDHFGKPEYVGAIPTGMAPVGLAVSPDGRWLYSTSELGKPAQGRPLCGRRVAGQDGSLSLISIATAERDPAHAVVASVSAGCSPVRVAVSRTEPMSGSPRVRATSCSHSRRPSSRRARVIRCSPACVSERRRWVSPWSTAAAGLWSRTPTGSALQARQRG